MTVGKKLHMSLGMLETVRGNFHTFAMDTQDPLAKQMYTSFATQLDQMTKDLSSRIEYVEQQEPQFKMEKMNQAQSEAQQANQQAMYKPVEEEH